MPATPPPSITPAPAQAPQRGDRTTFSARVDAFVTWVSAAVAQFGALASNVYNNSVIAFDCATGASTSAGNASTSAGNAATSASNAAASANVAGAYATYTGGFVSGTTNYSAKYWAQISEGAAAMAGNTVAFAETMRVVKGNLDPTRGLIFRLGSNVITGTDRILTVPMLDGTIARLEDLVPPTIVRNLLSSGANLGASQARQLIDCTGTFTLTFNAVATLGNGWFTYIRNNGTGIITLDPNASEGIDGVLSITLRPGQSRLIQCDGGALQTILLDNGSVDSFVNVHSDSGFGSTNTKIRRYSTVASNVGTAITYADSATLGASFTINEPGIYAIYTLDTVSGNNYHGVSVNSTQLVTDIHSIAVANRVGMTWNSLTSFGNVTFSTTVRLAVGDVIRPHGVGSGAGGNHIQFTIRKISA